MSSDNREDYLINILRLTNGSSAVKTTDISRYMGVAPASVTEMLKVLSREGLVNYEKYRGVSLTDEGIKAAKNLRRKHHIMERFLTGILNIDHESAHLEAHEIEHALSDQASAKLCRLIGTKVDSDCETCTDPCDEMIGVTAVSRHVSDMSPGDIGRITHLSSDNMVLLRRMISMGFTPGRRVELDSVENGTYVIRLDDVATAIDYAMASAVFVENIKE